MFSRVGFMLPFVCLGGVGPWDSNPRYRGNHVCLDLRQLSGAFSVSPSPHIDLIKNKKLWQVQRVRLLAYMRIADRPLCASGMLSIDKVAQTRGFKGSKY